MHRPRTFLAFFFFVAVGMAVAGAQGCASGGTGRAATEHFAGAWKVDWCEQGRTNPDCGGFAVYLVEEGGRICGSHYGVDSRFVRMDEGEIPSLSGAVQGDAAIVEIRSARNHSLIRARLVRVPAGIRWTTLATVEAGSNGEPALIPDSDVLVAAEGAENRDILAQVRQGCGRRQPH